MKKGRYLEQLESIIQQAKAAHDLDRIRLALIEARAIVELMVYAEKQKHYAIKLGVR